MIVVVVGGSGGCGCSGGDGDYCRDNYGTGDLADGGGDNGGTSLMIQ